MFAICISGVIFGITRAAIDAFIELAATRKGSGTNALLRDRPETQLSVARAEALLGAAQAYVSQTSDDV